jgi:hypothetical protein
MITIDKALELFLATLDSEGKSPRYIDWLRPLLLYFYNYLGSTKKVLLPCTWQFGFQVSGFKILVLH